ncbi:MAG: DUF255 domain-containing protein [Bacteroidetes bacterium]|nr:DUF255 domain-containing protein [Bacteroidota bacterium]
MDRLVFFIAVAAIALHAGISEIKHKRNKGKEQTEQTTGIETVSTDKKEELNTSKNNYDNSGETAAKPIKQVPSKITWMTLEEAQEAMKKEPKKLYVDVYTDWCGWCKVQDRKTFVNPEIISLMDEHFYAVKFDAEGRDSVMFDGKNFGYMPRMGRNGLNGWAHRYARNNGSLGYPTSLFFNENLERVQVLATYLDPQQMEKVLTYIGKDYGSKGVTWEQFVASFQSNIPAE